jgi:DNA invertase Pin-like site-specific DNA recombinase
VKLDAYVRVSRVGGRAGPAFISPQVQRERCEGAAQAGGHEIVSWTEDLDESGAKADRPGFQKVLARIESGQTDGIVVAKLDRFARSVADAANAMKRIEAAGGALMVAESSLDTSTSFGRFAMHMMLAMAELELDRIKEGWDTARANAVARGVHVASRTPTGYDRDPEKRLVPNRDAPVITELFRRKARGDSWNELAEVLEVAGVLTPYGAAHWTNGSMKSILENRAYLGEARSGEHIHVGAHEPLTDEVTWRAAQRIKQEPSRRKGASLLAGILRCAGCRYAMKPSRMTDRHGERLMMYSCRGKKAGGKCPAPTTILAHLIEPYVVDKVMERAGDESVRSVKLDGDITDAQRKVDQARAQRDAFLESDIGDVVGLDRFKSELQRRQDSLEEAEDRLSELVRRSETADLPSAVELQRIWPDLELEERRHLLRLGIDAVFLRRPPRRGLSAIDGRVFITWRGEGPDDLPGRDRRAPTIRSFDW